MAIDIVCSKCKKSRVKDFKKKEITSKRELKKAAYLEGWDIENKLCPECNPRRKKS